MPPTPSGHGSGANEDASHPLGGVSPRPVRDYRPGRGHHVENTIMSALVRVGLVPRSYLLTTRGRKTGQPRTNPVVPVEHDGRSWLVAPYGPVSWVHNARAAGRVRLTRRRDTRAYAVREVPREEAGPVLKRYFRLAPSARPYFQAAKDSPVQDFVAEADRHPVFELIPVGEDRQRDHPGR
jgi:deazaflavin-dependent oxidoreductase (nitroreductase family)